MRMLTVVPQKPGPCSPGQLLPIFLLLPNLHATKGIYWETPKSQTSPASNSFSEQVASLCVSLVVMITMLVLGSYLYPLPKVRARLESRRLWETPVGTFLGSTSK